MKKRSVLAVLAGVVLIVFAITLVDVVLTWMGIYPPPDQPIGNSLALLSVFYRTIFGIIGAGLAARLAPSKPMAHALCVGGICMALALADLVASWGDMLQPKWYSVALVLLALPRSWVGARVFGAISHRTAQSPSAGG